MSAVNEPGSKNFLNGPTSQSGIQGVPQYATTQSQKLPAYQPSTYVQTTPTQPQTTTAYIPGQTYQIPTTTQPLLVQQQYPGYQPVTTQAYAPVTTAVQVPAQSTPPIQGTPIKGESRIEYVPYEKTVMEYEEVRRQIQVPVTKQVTDYYAVQYETEYQPNVIQQKYIEYVPVERVQEIVEYQPITRQNVIYNPQTQQQTTQQYQLPQQYQITQSVLPQSQSQIIQQPSILPQTITPQQTYVQPPQTLYSPQYVQPQYLPQQQRSQFVQPQPAQFVQPQPGQLPSAVPGAKPTSTPSNLTQTVPQQKTLPPAGKPDTNKERSFLDKLFD